MALGRARRIVEEEFGAQVIYGDTDSIFIKFPTKDLAESIELGIAAGKRITDQCRKPYKIAYEKTFYPFILFCRKRYVGMMYEEDPNIVPKRKSMGIVLKRRDNAPIVKDVFGGALDVLLQEKDVRKAQTFVNGMLMRVLENQVPLEKFIVSKSLRDDYITTIPAEYIAALQSETRRLKEQVKVEKDDRRPALNKQLTSLQRYIEEGKATYNVLKDWSKQFDLPIATSSIAHRVLADRMESRDPGTAPKVGDRLQYIYVAEKKNAAKQGDRIEEIGFVRKNNLKPDTAFYITNQIQNPVAQLFALCIEELDGFVPPRKPSYGTLMDDMMDKYKDEEEATLAVLSKKEKQLENIMFLGSPTLSNFVRRNTRGPLDAFFVRK
jgi:DNA polymerase elongation subunit (family B)